MCTHMRIKQSIDLHIVFGCSAHRSVLVHTCYTRPDSELRGIELHLGGGVG